MTPFRSIFPHNELYHHFHIPKENNLMILDTLRFNTIITSGILHGEDLCATLDQCSMGTRSPGPGTCFPHFPCPGGLGTPWEMFPHVPFSHKLETTQTKGLAVTEILSIMITRLVFIIEAKWIFPSPLTSSKSVECIFFEIEATKKNAPVLLTYTQNNIWVTQSNLILVVVVWNALKIDVTD